MNNKLLLSGLRRLANNAPKRKLYTDHLYPYPNAYFNEKVYPTYHYYRENWEGNDRTKFHVNVSLHGMKIFWTWIWWNLFHDPGAFFGHHSLPDPGMWTDEELGIPPLEAGPAPLQ